jgi:hypothetical protein
MSCGMAWACTLHGCCVLRVALESLSGGWQSHLHPHHEEPWHFNHSQATRAVVELPGPVVMRVQVQEREPVGQHDRARGQDAARFWQAFEARQPAGGCRLQAWRAVCSGAAVAVRCWCHSPSHPVRNPVTHHLERVRLALRRAREGAATGHCGARRPSWSKVACFWIDLAYGCWLALPPTGAWRWVRRNRVITVSIASPQSSHHAKRPVPLSSDAFQTQLVTEVDRASAPGGSGGNAS